MGWFRKTIHKDWKTGAISEIYEPTVVKNAPNSVFIKGKNEGFVRLIKKGKRG